MTVTVYTFENAEGDETGFHTQDYREAQEYARDNQLRIIANEFEWADSEPLDDYRPKARKQRRRPSPR